MPPRFPRPEPAHRSLRMPPLPRMTGAASGGGHDRFLHFPAGLFPEQLANGALLRARREDLHGPSPCGIAAFNAIPATCFFQMILGLHFASRALTLVESLSMIGKLLGHIKIDTTARYAHLNRTH